MSLQQDEIKALKLHFRIGGKPFQLEANERSQQFSFLDVLHIICTQLQTGSLQTRPSSKGYLLNTFQP